MAARLVAAVNAVSRRLGRGSGTVIGGRLGLLADPGLLATLSEGRRVALVSGTNGKTTTTRLLTAAMGMDVLVASNETGANMPAGHVAALVDHPDAEVVVFEVDEGYVARLIEEVHPRVVVLLNLSRDQLDRTSEVRMLADRWRSALASQDNRGRQGDKGVVVVANADDPLVVWAASASAGVHWVGAGQVWRQDSVGCPACGARIEFTPSDGWLCWTCGFARPDRQAWLEGNDLVLAGGARHRLRLALPGRFNRANAALVAVAAPLLVGSSGDDIPSLATVLGRMADVSEVAGRFSTVRRRGRDVRMMLAKNPAGWMAILDLLDDEGDPRAPVVLSVNARGADGLDTSWLWDVPFDRLAGRSIVATGERQHDLALRLRYAEVDHRVVSDPVAAVDAAVAAREAMGHLEAADLGPAPGEALPEVEFIGNYTAFTDLRSRL